MTKIGFTVGSFSAIAIVAGLCAFVNTGVKPAKRLQPKQVVRVFHDANHDMSPSLLAMSAGATGGTLTVGSLPPNALAPTDPDEPDEPGGQGGQGGQRGTPPVIPVITVPAGSAAVEQTSEGKGDSPQLLQSFDALGAGFEGPQGTSRFNNPSDNSLAVGPDYIFQIVNSRIAIFTKKGRKFKETGKCLFGPVPTNVLFKGFGGAAEAMNSGDAVVRFDQLANRWLIVMPLFRRGAERADVPPAPKAGDPAQLNMPAHPQPGPAAQLYVPKPSDTPPAFQRGAAPASGPYSMCYAVSVGPDPLGAYYRYEFLRPLFPDYPRPAIWPDGYYVPTSTGDGVIQKQACVVERDKMLRGEPASEQIVIIDGVNFLNNADIDGHGLPPKGAPNIMMAAGGTQLKKIFEDDGIYYWKFHVDWKNPANTKLTGPVKIPVAPYHYLGDGQLSNCVPQPGVTRRLDSQGDKLMARLVYRRVNGHESIVAVHSINTSAGGGGVRWYEFRLDKNRDVQLYQQGTYCPNGAYRWLPSPAMDKFGNIGIGYTFGGDPNFPGQRFAGRLANDPLGQLTEHETILADGAGAQNQERWEDYSQTAVDPSDDRTIWYVGDYIKSGNTTYSSRIGAFRLSK